MNIKTYIDNGNVHELFEELYKDIPKNTDALREFHNRIKGQLIFDSKRNTNGEKLLDVAVGRGGDIMKWSRAKFKYVTGFDSDKKSIYEKHAFDGAIKRFQSLKKGNIYTPKCFFWNISATDPNVLEILNGKDRGTIYDVVSCQFAIHYFINDLDILLNMISKKLRKGGLFIGTTIDGDLLFKNLEKGDIKIPFLNVSKKTEKSYIYEIVSSGDNSSRETYYDYRGALSEYFVFKEKTVEMCKKYSLELVRIRSFHEWNEDIKITLSLHEQIISYFNFSFVFIKI